MTEGWIAIEQGNGTNATIRFQNEETWHRVSAIPIPTREEMERRFEKSIDRLENCNGIAVATMRYYDSKCWFLKCYDFLFDKEEERKEPIWYDDWF